MQRANVFFADENYEKARVELKNVIQIDPKSAGAYNLLGQVEEGARNLRKAVASYSHAIELSPDYLAPRIRLGRFYLRQAASARAANQDELENSYIETVREQVDAAQRIAPEHIDTRVLSASFLAYQGKDDEAIAILARVLKTAPENIDARLLLSRVYRHKNNIREAEAVLVEGRELQPAHVGIRVELAAFYEQQKRLDEATGVMREVIQLDPREMAYRKTLAYYYLRQQQPEKAEQTYREAIAAAPGEISRYLAYADFIHQQKSPAAAIAYLEQHTELAADTDKAIAFKLADFYRQAEENEQAIAVLENIAETSKHDLAGMRARKQLISLHLAGGEESHARRLIDEVLAENPNDHEVILLKAGILKREKNYNAAIALYRSALKDQPDSIAILHQLAQTHLLNGETELAGDLLKRAVKTEPDNVSAHTELARFLLASGEPRLALEQIDRGLETAPGNIDAIIMKTDILMRQGKIAEVTALLDQLKKLAPDNAQGWFRMGRIYKFENNKEKARQEFITAWQKDPDSIDLLAELTDMEITLGKTDEAKARLGAILEKQPQHPAAHKFLAMVYLFEKQVDRAEKELLLQLQQDPADVAALLQLAGIQLGRGNINQAAAYYSKGLQLAPDNIEILTGLAGIRLAQRRYDDAITLYQQALAVQPDNAAVINNLAMILVDNKSDPASLSSALQLIQSAKQKEHPALQDTLGWIYYRMGEYDQARAALQKAVTRAPGIPTFHYHLAMVAIKQGNNELAKKHLQKALTLGNFPQRNAAASALDALAK